MRCLFTRVNRRCPSTQQFRSFSTEATEAKVLPVSETHHVRSQSALTRTFSNPSRAALSSLMFECSHTPGALQRVISSFETEKLNMRRIESRPHFMDSNQFTILVDVEASEDDPRVKKIVDTYSPLNDVSLNINPPRSVPWFPQHVSDLDGFSDNTLDAGEDLESDHPGFNDAVYRERRKMIVTNAMVYKYGLEIPRVQYSAAEQETWTKVYNRLKTLYPRFACPEFVVCMEQMKKHCGYAEDNIPQLEDISQYLQTVTNFRLRPVAGLLTARDFLNALAFRTFFSTQYIRHSSKPFFTPEPDICHELLGHVPMLADPNFADFSQAIGLASLGASDSDIKRLATCYWFSVEFGLLKDENDPSKVKAYGAGLLSSFGELEYACGLADEKPQVLDWEPAVAAETEYPITTYQPIYFAAQSLSDAKEKMNTFCANEIARPFYVTYEPKSQTIAVDRNVAPLSRR